jgi:lysophospholipase L1-like esterase
LTRDVKRVTLVSMKRGIALGVPGVALATAGGLLVQVRQATNAPLPRFEDLDPSGTYGDPAATPVRISVLGDSSMTGPGLELGEQIWVAQLAHMLPWSVTLTSHAKGGSRVRDVLERQVDRALDQPPDVFVLSVGANDAMHATPLRIASRRRPLWWHSASVTCR